MGTYFGCEKTKFSTLYLHDLPLVRKLGMALEGFRKGRRPWSTPKPRRHQWIDEIPDTRTADLCTLPNIYPHCMTTSSSSRASSVTAKVTHSPHFKLLREWKERLHK